MTEREQMIEVLRLFVADADRNQQRRSTLWSEAVAAARLILRDIKEGLSPCVACLSNVATTTRLDAPVCDGCAHMIDAHGAKLHDAYAVDPCEATT